ncbi:MAG: hypothetical protein UIH41_00635, partial [Treponemataceae bacterium]|nr:hypothetical protein [Treponemataceae bacterium]
MDWTVNDLKQKLETDISDENARKSILKIFANIIEKTHHLNPSNWNISFRKGGTGIRFQLNFGHRYVLGVYADSILVMNKRETFLNFPKDFISEILNECDFVNDGTNKTPKPTTVEELENYPPEELWNNSIQFKIPFSKCEKYLETLEPAICDFAKWCTDNRKINPQSEDAHVSAFIDYLNQELETSIPQPEYEDKRNFSFTWIPFYQEMAEKLLQYKDNRDELVKIVYGMDEEDVSFFKDDKKKNFKDLHPFALYGIFNRQISSYKKNRICTYLKDKLQIKSNIPLDFDGLPTVDNRNSWWGMPWSKNDASKDIKSNWELFEIIQEKQINEDDLKNEFNFILSRGGAKKYLTMALYWIRPYEFIPLDSNSREYLQKIGINVFAEKDLNGKNYLNLC